MQIDFGQDFVREKLSTQKNRKDKFKPHFCGKDFYRDHQSEFKTLEFLTAGLSLKNKVILYTITLCCLRRKADWYAGRRSQKRQINIKFRPTDFQIYQIFNELRISWPKNLEKEITFYIFLSEVQIKPLPRAAQDGLFYFFTGDYDLEILTYEPDPFEILKLQIQNKRVLTFEPDHTVWPEKNYGERDVLSFLLHDFIHAEHFFSDLQKRSGQVGFYKFIHRILEEPLMDMYLQNTVFHHQFSYLISDMNSHVIHLLKTLKAIIDEAKLNQHLWEKICVSVATSVSESLRRINEISFSKNDAIEVSAYFENFGAPQQL